MGEVAVLELSQLPVHGGHGQEDLFKKEKAASTVEAGKGWGMVGNGEGLAGAASRSLRLFRSVPRMALASESNGNRGAVSAVIEDDMGEIARSIVRGRWELKRETKTAGLSPFVKSLALGIFTRHLSEGMPGEWMASTPRFLLLPGLDDDVAACLQTAHPALSPLRLIAARPPTPTSRQPLAQLHREFSTLTPSSADLHCAELERHLSHNSLPPPILHPFSPHRTPSLPAPSAYGDVPQLHASPDEESDLAEKDSVPGVDCDDETLEGGT